MRAAKAMIASLNPVQVTMIENKRGKKKEKKSKKHLNKKNLKEKMTIGKQGQTQTQTDMLIIFIETSLFDYSVFENLCDVNIC